MGQRVHLPKISLKDRVLYSDGDSVVSPSQIMSLISAGASTEGLFVEQLADAIQQFNLLVPKKEQIGIKESTRVNDLSWDLPQEYADMHVMLHIVKAFYALAKKEDLDMVSNAFQERQERVIDELKIYHEMGLEPVLRVLIYIINTLHEKNIVWGVGRGSSVSSYVLYVIGVHDVDSVEYDLDIHDFLRT